MKLFLINNTKPPLTPKFINLTKNEVPKLRWLPDEFLPAQKIGTYEDFMEKIRKNYGEISLKKLLRESRKLRIGSGANAFVFAIKGVDDYVLKVKRGLKIGLFSKVPPLKKVKNELYSYNFGQPVADNNNGVEVLMKCDGEPYSFRDWYDVVDNGLESAGDVHRLVEQMTKIADFPQESFDNFAKKVYFLKNIARKEPDLFNPNNILVDYKNKVFNLIDIDKQFCASPVPLYLDTLVSTFTEGHMPGDVLNLLNENGRAKYANSAKIIEEKCKKALIKQGFTKCSEMNEPQSPDKEKINALIELVNDLFEFNFG